MSHIICGSPTDAVRRHDHCGVWRPCKVIFSACDCDEVFRFQAVTAVTARSPVISERNGTQNPGAAVAFGVFLTSGSFKFGASTASNASVGSSFLCCSLYI